MRTVHFILSTIALCFFTSTIFAQQVGETIRFNLYYDIDKAFIKPKAATKLEAVLKVMNQYPDMVIELSSHTDSRASYEYNLNLSTRRAKSAKNWLVKNGIETERIKAVGYGEKKLVNSCSDGVSCNESDHQLNRRTEMKVLVGPDLATVAKSLVTVESEQSCGCADLTSSIRNEGTISEDIPAIEFENAEVSKSKSLQTLEVESNSQLIKKRYKFSNKSNLPLYLKSVKAKDFSVQVVDWQKAKLKRGEIGWIDIVFDPMVSKEDYGLQHAQLIMELEGIDLNEEVVTSTSTLVLMSKLSNSETQVASRIK